ncbi:MAG TPA: hypothetical protein VK305_14865, partial [Roseateles sp.]|nr:hypothetical protein [Roseateles sp.]
MQMLVINDLLGVALVMIRRHCSSSVMARLTITKLDHRSIELADHTHDAASSTLTYDANGNVSSRTGFDGVKSCHAYDLSRNLETARLEGLRSQDACPADIGAQAIAAETSQRKTTTQWHPDWSLEAKQAEPGMITTSVY